MEIFLVLLAVAAFFVGNKLGTDNGRRQTLENLNQRIAIGLNEYSEFKNKYGVRGTHLILDYMGEDAKLGTGYNPSPYVDFVVIHGEDFVNQVERLRSKNSQFSEPEDDETPIETDNESAAASVPTQDAKLFQPSAALSEIVGTSPQIRSDVAKKLMEYVESNCLQDPNQQRMINCDAKLKAIFGVDKISYFGIAGKLEQHLS